MNRLLDILGAVQLTVAVLAVILVACAAGTFMRLEAGLERIFHAPWFFALLGILAVNTIACVLKEVRRRRVPWSFLCLHLGAVVILAGGTWGHLKGEKGYVSIPEGMAATQFYPNWTVEDRLVRSNGETINGEFRGIEQGQVVFTPRFEEPVPFPQGEVQAVFVDTNRPGRHYEADILHMSEGKHLQGFVQSIEGGEVHIEADGKMEKVSGQEVVFLRMGSTAVRPLGFTLRLKDFKIEYYPETMENLIFLKTPAGKSAELRPEPGLEADLGDGYGAKILRYLPDALVDSNNELISRSDSPNNPAVEVEISWDGGTEKLTAFAKFPSFHGSKKQSGVDVKFLSTTGMPKAYISEVEVIDEDVPVSEEIIKVNSPFTYDGYTFYQSSYSLESKPIRSVFQVVKDPGLGLAYAGFILMTVGCIGLLYIRPLRNRFRRQRNAAPPSPDMDKPQPVSPPPAKEN